MGRTTLRIEEDALKVARRHAARHRVTLGEAVSDLIRQAADRPLVTDARSGLRVVRLGRRSPRVTSALVDRLREDLPATFDRGLATLAGGELRSALRIVPTR